MDTTCTHRLLATATLCACSKFKIAKGELNLIIKAINLRIEIDKLKKSTKRKQIIIKETKFMKILNIIYIRHAN